MDQLPTEMKQEIFGFLTKKDLISVASTCKKLRSFILKSKCLMEYLTFKLMDFEAQQDYVANYGCGLMRICIGPTEPNAKSMKMNQTDMKFVFSSIPNVQEMQINQLTLPATKKPIEDLEFPSLKKLVLNNRGNNVNIFNYLHGCQVLEFTSSVDKFSGKIFDAEFLTWFNTQTEIKSVSLIGQAINNFSKHIDVNNVKIKLKKLSLNCEFGAGRIEIDFNNLCEFLKQQDEVEEIVLENFGRFRSFYYMDGLYEKTIKQIMFDMKSLKTLKLKGNFFLTNFREVNLALEKLVLDREMIRQLYINFPKVKNLKILKSNGLDHFDVGNTHVLEMHILSQMTDLEKLKIYDYSLISAMEAGDKFKKLMKLTLSACYLRPREWKLLVAQTPLVEKLKLDMFQLSNDSVLSFINWKKLKQLDLRFGFYQDEIVHVLCQCQAFNHLKITKSTKTQFEDQLNNVDFKVEILKKPTDKDYKYRVDYFMKHFQVLTPLYQCNKDDIYK